uniref:exodeoxyribonuclease VII large subunit n=1 Tax=Demequina sp. TaxID=2050685 RepID=UPI0025FD53DB
VADLRASTPTDAGKRIVPDAAAESAGLRRARAAMAAAIDRGVHRERAGLAALRTRPVLARPATLLLPYSEAVARLRGATRHALAAVMADADSEVRALAASLRALSPQGTLDRGFAVVRTPAGEVVRDAAEVRPGDPLRIRVARGEIAAVAGD